MSSSASSGNEELARLIGVRSAKVEGEASKALASSELSWPCLLMRMGKRWCGLRAESVLEVVAPEAITRIPAQPKHVLGVTLVHGRLVPAIDLGAMVPNMELALERPPGRRLVVVSHEEAEIGLVADEARGVTYLPALAEGAHGAERPGFIMGEVRWQEYLVCMLETWELIRAALGIL